MSCLFTGLQSPHYSLLAKGESVKAFEPHREAWSGALPFRCGGDIFALMSDESASTERKRNIWAPWRMEYINGLGEDRKDGCFLCRYRDEPDQDKQNLVLWRGGGCFAVLNRFPYTGGHSLIAPLDHVASLDDLADSTMLEMMQMIRDLKRLLAASIHAEGFNIGMNIGRCAGVGLPDHLHVHVVPRWGGDTNFMAVLGGVNMLPQALGDIYEQLTKASAELHLPKLSQ